LAKKESAKGKVALLMAALLVLAIVLVVAGMIVWLRPPKAERFRRKGEIFLARGRAEAAEKEFRRALEIDAGLMEAREGLVRALAAEHDYAKALAELERAEAKGLKKDWAAFLRAWVLNNRAEYRMASAGKAAGAAVCDDVLKHEIEPALALCRQHLEALSDGVKGNTILGEIYSTQGRILQSKRDFLLRDMAVAQKAGKVDLLKAKRDKARETNQALAAVLRRATAAFERVLELEPSNVNARLTLARFALRGRVGRPKRAKLLLEPVLKEHPDNKEAIKRMAEAEHMAGNEKEALAMVRRLPASERTDEAVLFEAEVLIALERWKDADALLRGITNVLAQKPERVKLPAAFLQGKVLRKLNRPEEAANFLQNIFSDPGRKWAEARYELARALQEAGLREQAIAAYKLVERDALAARVPNVRAYRRLRETLYEARMALARAWLEDSPLRAGRYASRAFFRTGLRRWTWRERAF